MGFERRLESRLQFPIIDKWQSLSFFVSQNWRRY